MTVRCATGSPVAPLVSLRSDEYEGFPVGVFSCPFCNQLHEVDVTVIDGEVVPCLMPARCCNTWVRLVTDW